MSFSDMAAWDRTHIVGELDLRRLGQAIRERREAMGMSQEALADYCAMLLEPEELDVRKVGQSYISRIESGSTPNPGLRFIEIIARALKVGIGALISEADRSAGAHGVQQKLEIVPARSTRQDYIDPSQYEYIPLINSTAPMGQARAVNEHEIEDHIIIKGHLLKGHAGQIYAIRVIGASMQPTLDSGDIIAVEVESDISPRSVANQIVAARPDPSSPDSEITIKRLIIARNTPDHVYLKADNEEWEKEQGGPLFVPIHPHLIVGKVLWAWRRFQ